MELSDFVNKRNAAKAIFTPGPGPLLEENILGLGPAFGRGDSQYEMTESTVMNKLAEMSGLQKLVRFQGSGSLAVEVMVSNFIFGKVLLVDTGFYSKRIEMMLSNLQGSAIKTIVVAPYESIEQVYGRYDWVIACVTETSRGSLQSIKSLRKLSDRLQAKLALDAVASFGLENDHELADVFAFSSCKGLFGFTGAGFVAYDTDPQNHVNSFNLSITTHLSKSMTGPYHAIQSLSCVLPIHKDFKQAVIVNKRKFADIAKGRIPLEPARQPLLCTRITGKITSSSLLPILYEPRETTTDSIVSHLGEIHLQKNSKGAIFDLLDLSNKETSND